MHFLNLCNLNQSAHSDLNTKPQNMYMYLNLTICTLSTPNMSLISQGMLEISGVSKLSWTAGHPVVLRFVTIQCSGGATAWVCVESHRHRRKHGRPSSGGKMLAARWLLSSFVANHGPTQCLRRWSSLPAIQVGHKGRKYHEVKPTICVF